MIGSGSSGCSSSLLHDHRRLRFVFEHLPFEFRRGGGEGGVRISRNSPPSPGLFLRRREFRSRLKNNSAGLARAGSFPVDFTATAHLDRSIAIFRLFSLSLFFSSPFSFDESTATMVVFIFHSFTDESRAISTILDESRRENRPRDFLSFPFSLLFKQACDICMIFVHLVNLYSDVVSPRIFLFSRNNQKTLLTHFLLLLLLERRTKKFAIYPSLLFLFNIRRLFHHPFFNHRSLRKKPIFYFSRAQP